MCCIKPWPVKDIVAIVQVDGLFYRTCVDTGQAAQNSSESAIADGVVVGPGRSTAFPTTSESPAKSPSTVWIHQAADDKFVVVQIVRGNWLVVVAFLADERAERHLKSIDRSQRYQQTGRDDRGNTH